VSSSALQLIQLFYPPYYNSTAARLYNFDGKAEGPSTNSTIAISWEWRTGRELLNSGYKVIIYSADRVVSINEGAQYNVIVGYQFFSSYEEAEAYASAQQSGSYDIGGLNPFATIVPLEALADYQRVYPEHTLPEPNGTTSPTTVKIFEYLGSDES
jgi:hypothetical protein